MTQILVVKPGTLSSNDKGKLRKADIVTIEADRPEDVRLIGTEGPPMDGNDLLYAALSAMYRTPEGNYARSVKATFVDQIAQIMGASRKNATP